MFGPFATLFFSTITLDDAFLVRELKCDKVLKRAKW